jgi:hypothetical protein
MRRSPDETAVSADGGGHSAAVEPMSMPVAALCAAGVAVLSVVYAVAYLIIAPSAQRSSDATSFFTSYLHHPFGLRLASLCLAVSGVASGLAVVALADWLRRRGHDTVALRWATVAGVGAGLLTSIHGLADLVEVDRLARRFADGDAVASTAAVTVHSLPSPIDPRGLITFGIAGVVALVFGTAMRDRHRRIGLIGVLYGADLVALFFASALSVNAAVLVTGGLASLLLGPAWWLMTASILRSDRAVAPRH